MIIAQFAAVIPRQLALVAGVARKLSHPSTVKDLYCSSWWRLARNYVESSQLDWMVLSSRYGLLHPEQTLAPYEENPNERSKEQHIAWSEMVATQLIKLAPTGSTFIFLGGNKYKEFVIPYLHSHHLDRKYLTITPIAGLGIGLQKQCLQQMAPQYMQLSIF